MIDISRSKADITKKLEEFLCAYDKARKAEGYTVAYRRWALYVDVANGRHIETMYLHPLGKSLLVKTMPDGGTAAWEPSVEGVKNDH
jgi:hypothetical protein